MFQAANATPSPVQMTSVSASSGVSHAASSAAFTIRDLVDILRRNLVVILGAGILLAAIAFFASITMTPRFSATAQILVEPENLRILQNELTQRQQSGDGGITVVESQVRVVSSDNVLRRVITALDLTNDREFFRRASWRGTAIEGVLIGLGLASSERDPIVAVLDVLQRNLRVRRTERTFVIDITYMSEDRDKAVLVANAVVQAYLDEQSETRQEAARRATTSLSGRLDELRTRVRLSEEKVERFRRDNDLVASGGRLVAEQQLSEVNAQLVLARSRLAEVQARADQTRSNGGRIDPSASPEVLQSLEARQIRTLMTDLSRQEAELISRLGVRHPQVIDVRAQQAALQRRMDSEITRITQGTRNELDRAIAAERSLSRSLEALKRETSETNQSQVQLRELEREAEVSRTVYQAFLVRARETNEQERLDTTNTRVISSATPARQRSWPPAPTLMAPAGLIMGLVLGIGLAVGREAMSKVIRSRRGLRQAIGPVPIWHLPEADGGKKSRRTSDPNDATLPMILLDRPGSDFSREVRTLWTEIYEGSSSDRTKTVLVLSAEPTQARSTLALNLALAAGGLGARTLLVDADLLRRSLTVGLAVETWTGVADVLKGRKTLAEAVVRDPANGVDFLPAIETAGKAREKAPDAREAQGLIAAVQDVEAVLVDGGPILNGPAVRAFADVVDTIIIVAHSGSTNRDDISAAVKMLGHSSTKIRAAVLMPETGKA